MIAIGDPVRAGLVPSLARPGANTTGNTILGTEMSAKRLQLLKELVPGLRRVAFLWNPNNGSHLGYLEEWRGLAPKLGLDLLFVDVGSPNQFESKFAAMMREQPGALSVTADPFHMSHVGWMVDFAAKRRLPAMYILKDNVAAGGLMSYGPSIADLYRRAAGYAHKILQGTKPAELPVEQPVKFELAVNLKTAKALGLEVPAARHRRRGRGVTVRENAASRGASPLAHKRRLVINLPATGAGVDGAESAVNRAPLAAEGTE